MNRFRHRQIAELFADADQLVDHGFELAEGLDLLPVKRHQGGIGEAHRTGLAALLAGEQGIGAALDDGAVGVLDRQELLGERAAAQFAQIGELGQESLAPAFQVGGIGGGGFHIVV